MKFRPIPYRLITLLILVATLVSACSSGASPQATEKEIIIGPDTLMTEAALSEPTDTPQPTVTSAPPPTATPEGPTPIPSPTNTLNPYDTLLFNGEQFRANGDHNQALAQYSEAIKMEPSNPKGYIFRARAYNDLGQTDSAIQDANFAINYDPNNADAYNVRGVAWSLKDQNNQAILDFTKAIELNPNLAGAYSNRGYSYLQQKEYEKALQDYRKTAELAPNPESYFNLGQAYLTVLQDTGEPTYLDESQAAFEQVLALAPEQPDVHFNLGYIAMNKGDAELAVQYFNKAIELLNNVPLYYLYRGTMLRELGRCQEAMADLDQVLALAKDPELRQPAEQMKTEVCPPPTPAAPAGTPAP